MQQFPLTSQQFNELRTKLLEQGITLPDGNAGAIEFRGIRMSYLFDGSSITLKVLDKPFLVPTSMIWEKVSEWLQR